ncbi:universal stress protein [Nitrospirillum viridazoti]|uniref:Universal stress protein n=1 Tax=Nitrospirillum viridazoti CBAmc TaxID=1441467 RepID=A0A248K3H5_9PROT|nr:universal stress protein [Nitrospirillum amazonense]ASG25281.1 universal stress protein [Nitrospirillum amazonense CBAmc]TWB35362.1 universal stress protein family protein [Nitrospirillum amazonense]
MITEILVHLDGSSDDEYRLLHAEHLATAHRAHIRGLYCESLPEIVLTLPQYAVSRGVASEQMSELKAQADRTEKAIRLRLDKLSVPYDLRRFDILLEGVDRVVASQARTADLTVVRTPYQPGFALPGRAPEFVEAALFGSGRGVFVVPEEEPARLRPLDTVLVAWTDSKEAANAVAQAMPFLKKATQVVVAMVEGDKPAEAGGTEPGADVARYLDRHGVTVELRHLREWNTVSEALFNEAKRLDAGLLVAGAYGHSRLREWVLGGVTRDILTKTPLPALLAH